MRGGSGNRRSRQGRGKRQRAEVEALEALETAQRRPLLDKYARLTPSGKMLRCGHQDKIIFKSLGDAKAFLRECAAAEAGTFAGSRAYECPLSLNSPRHAHISGHLLT